MLPSRPLSNHPSRVTGREAPRWREPGRFWEGAKRLHDAWALATATATLPFGILVLRPATARPCRPCRGRASGTAGGSAQRRRRRAGGRRGTGRCRGAVPGGAPLLVAAMRRLAYALAVVAVGFAGLTSLTAKGAGVRRPGIAGGLPVLLILIRAICAAAFLVRRLHGDRSSTSADPLPPRRSASASGCPLCWWRNCCET